MANHLRNVFAGDSLPAQRPSASFLPDGPCVTDHDRLYLCKTFDLVDCPGVSYPISSIVMADSVSAADCPSTIDCITFMLQRKLARRKAPGVDHLRAEMLVPLIEDLAPCCVFCSHFAGCGLESLWISALPKSHPLSKLHIGSIMIQQFWGTT
ncbi:hypothetical protein MUCCIDRAFT_77527 [Mucor lusitanicus CBS 277.49]|uniref:Uncharacterized protein n=1 Tax=Mucor lusitanicus CBS 277.49 TaxID=747725 RepID=A0A168PC15_MUCCL|nr:hypothetical protein MUCCIDRAFT_77527 [Mucor lusitanicus CBS 277.49]